MPARRFDLIVFDWDGTLFDSTRLIARCIQAACADLGAAVPSDRDASYVIGLGLADALRHAAPDVPSERYAELAERYRHHYLTNQDSIPLQFENTPPGFGPPGPSSYAQKRGNVFDSQFPRARGDNLELTLGPAGAAGTIVRLLAYENHARMGRYAAAVARARATGAVPDVAADDRQGRPDQLVDLAHGARRDGRFGGRAGHRDQALGHRGGGDVGRGDRLVRPAGEPGRRAAAEGGQDREDEQADGLRPALPQRTEHQIEHAPGFRS